MDTSVSAQLGQAAAARTLSQSRTTPVHTPEHRAGIGALLGAKPNNIQTPQRLGRKPITGIKS